MNLQQPLILFLQVDGRVHAVHIALIQLAPQQVNGFSESLKMNHLPFPEELDDIIDIRIIAEPEDVVIGDPGLLLWHAAKSTTIENWLFGNKRLISAIFLFIFLCFTNSGFDRPVSEVAKMQEKTRVTILKEKASATSSMQCRIDIGQA